MKLHFRRSDGAMLAADKESIEYMQSLKYGEVVSFEVKRVRNYAYHRKWFALANFLFDYKCELFPHNSYNGVVVKPSFERFRKDLIIKTGRFTPVFDCDGNCVLEADSISFSAMDHNEFDKFYSDTIDVALSMMSGRTEQELRDTIDGIMGFM